MKKGYIKLLQEGSQIVIEKNMSKEEYQNMKAEIVENYSDLVNEINLLVRNIRNKVCRCNPLQLLNRLELNFLSGLINVPSEFFISHDSVVLRIALGYVQSIIVSSLCVESGEDVDNLYDEIVHDIGDLLDKINLFYLAFSMAHKDELYEWEEERFEAQFNYLVAGNRYQCFEKEYYSKLLAPHNEIFLRLFGITSKDITQGICKLNYSLSSERIDNFRDMYECYVSDIKSEEKNIFGIGYNDVLRVTGWPKNFVRELSFRVGENDKFFSEGEYAGWPIVDMPVHKRPFIEIDGRYYCFDIYNFLDKFYRVLQKTVCRLDNSYSWNDNQKNASEEMVAGIFYDILPGCEVYRNNFYPKNLSIRDKCENDIVIKYKNIVIIVEVKAGSFVYTTPLTDFKNYIKSLKSLIENPNHQCYRTYEYVFSQRSKGDVKFYDDRGNLKFNLRSNSVKSIYMISVTVDNITSFAAKSDKLAFLKQKIGVISLCIDDLLVYKQYFDSPLKFLHFLHYRQKATLEKHIALNDEMDHLGMYIHYNDYVSTYKDVDGYDKINFVGYCNELDEYFGKLYCPELFPRKPEQELPPLYVQLLKYLDCSNQDDKVDIAYFLLNYGLEGRQLLCDNIGRCVERQRELGYCIPVSSVVKSKNEGIRYTCFVEQPGICGYTDEEKKLYVWKRMLHNEEDDRICFTVAFDLEGDIQGVTFVKMSIDDIPIFIRESLKCEEKQHAMALVDSAEIKLGRKIGRNELCPCGSGKKYKKCCGR